MYYYDVLPKKIIIELGLIIKDFDNGKSSYEELVLRMKNKGFDVTPVLTDFSKTMMTVNKAKEIQERRDMKHFISNDIRYFVINSKEYSNVSISVKHDYKMIETLAYYGDMDCQKMLVNILKYQLKIVGDYSKDEKKQILINNWKNQIKYFEEQILLKSEQSTIRKKDKKEDFVMENILAGNVYNYGNVFHLVLLSEDTTSKRKMYWCSMNRNKDDLVKVTDFCFVTPNEEWQYVETISNEQYTQALSNFRVQQEKYLHNSKTK